MRRALTTFAASSAKRFAFGRSLLRVPGPTAPHARLSMPRPALPPAAPSDSMDSRNPGARVATSGFDLRNGDHMRRIEAAAGVNSGAAHEDTASRNRFDAWRGWDR